ncbi:MAG: hypothetical protein JNJ58_02820 [Chitinophagaceae bacterium]|nr:hypothetical protein [Chitinophagaceae bacterium]
MKQLKTKQTFLSRVSSGYGRMMMLLAVLLVSWSVSSAQTTLIGPANGGDFDLGGTFAANGWSVSGPGIGTAPVNEWFVGTGSTVVGAPFAGNQAYISSNGGVSNIYNTASSTSIYFWRDVTIPIGEPAQTITFNWVGNGESTWDQIQVFSAPTTVNPVAELYPGSGNAVFGASLAGSTYLGSFHLQASIIQTGTVSFLATPGTTRRIIFAWKSDVSVGNPPSGTIDNITMVSSASFPTATATAIGGLWSSPATWVGGVLPSGNAVIPAGSIVTVDQAVNLPGDLTIAGTLQWNGTSNAMTIGGNLTINPGGRFLPYTAVATPLGQTVNIGGNFVNDGYANCALGTGTQCLINFNGAGSTLSGSGIFEGDGTRGIIRQLFFQNLGANSITTTQNLTTYSLGHTAGSLNTNGKLKIDNTAKIHGLPINTQVSSVAVTNMGSLYNAAPTLFGTATTIWAAGAAATANTRYRSGNDVYLCTTAGTFGASAPVNTTPVSEANGTATVLWIGNIGTLGNPFQVTAVTLGTQYFCGNNLYTCIVAGTPSVAAPPTCTGPGSTCVSGTATFRWAGSPAKVSVNYDAATQTVRSLNIVSNGSGYSSATAPTLVYSLGVTGGTGSGAASFPVIMYANFGPVNSLAQRSGVATITGGLTINSDQDAGLATADPQASSGVGMVYTTNGGVNYTVAPTVGFAGPTAINLITNPGSGYLVAPTVTVTGGTLISGTALTSANFTVTTNQGMVQSVYLNASTTACYSVPPTLSLTASPGVTATLAFPAGCWPAATANIGDNGQITSFTMTNAGYGYIVAPTVGLGTTGTFTTAATTPVARVALYNLTLNFFTPALTSVVCPDDAIIPANRKMQNLTLAGNGNGLTLTGGNLNLFGSTPLSLTTSLSTPGNILDLNGNNLNFTWNAYAGLTTSAFGGASSNAYVKNGSITLTGRGGAGTFNYPFAGTATTGSLIWFVGSTPTAVTTGCNATKYTVTELGAPTNAFVGSGVGIGTRSYRAQFNPGAVSGLNPTMTLKFNSIDGLTSTQDLTYVADAPAQNGPWTIRSAAYGVSGALPASGLQTSATVAPGPIAATGDNYYAFATIATSITSFTPNNTCGGGTVVITGAGFAGTTSVTFGGVPAFSYVVNSPTQITAIVDNAGASGDVVVTSPTGTASSPGYIFNGVGPITSITPSGLITICPGASAVLTAQPNTGLETYLWSANAGSSTSDNVTVTAAGTYTVTVTDIIGGCSNTATATVVINTPPSPIPTATPNSLCLGSTSQLNAGTFVSGTLSTPNNTNNSSGATGFDITNTSAVPVTLHYFSYQSTSAIGTVAPQSVYYNPNPMNCTFPTNVTTAPGWILIGTVSTTSAGPNPNPYTQIPLNCNITIPPGATYAFAVGGTSQAYTTGTSGCPVMATTPHLSVKEGFGGTLTGTIANRRWNGSVTYDYGDPNLTYAWTETPAGSTLNNNTIINPVATPTTTTDYQVTATNSFGCSGTATVTVTALPVPPAPVASSVSQCGVGSQILTATGTGGTLNWYNAATGGTLINTGATYTTPVLNTTTSYWVEETNGICISTRTQVTVTVLTPDAITLTATPSVFCGAGGTTSMTATSNNVLYTYTWSPAPLSTSGAFNESASDLVNASTVYTVTGTDGSCTATASVAITVNPLPVIFSLTATPAIICPGGTSQLMVTSNAFTINYSYDFTAGLSGWTTGNQPTIGGGGASLPSSWAIQSWGNPTPSLGTTSVGGEHSWILSPQMTLNPGTLSIAFSSFTNNETGTYDNEFLEYSVDNGATWIDLTSQIPATWDNNVAWTNYTATATIASPTSQGRIRFRYDNFDGCCGGTGTNNGFYVDNVSITTPGTGGTALWAAATNLSNANIVNPVATPPATETYTVTVADMVGCSTTGTVTVTVSPVPPAPVASGVTQCGLGSASLSATGTGGTLNWYDAAVAGTLVNTGATFNTPVLNTTTSYWVEEYNGACSGPRTQVTVTVTVPDVINIVSADPFICTNVAPLSTTLTASSLNPAYVYSWSPAPGSTSGSFNETATVSPVGTTTYTVTGTGGGCTNVQTVVVTVGTAPSLSATATPASIPCGGTSQLEVTTPGGCNNYVVSSIPLAPTSPAGPTNPGPAGDDVLSPAVAIGFPFTFYGNTYSNVFISTNGFISFNSLSGAGCCNGQLLPSPGIPDDVVALAWSDLNTNSGGTIDYYNLTSPNRLVVRYNNVNAYVSGGGSGAINGQIILYDNGKIEVHTSSSTLTYPTNVITQGIENATGSLAATVSGRNASLWTSAGDAYKFEVVCPTANPTWTPAGSLSNAGIPNPVATPASTTTYTVSASDVVGCVGTATTMVTVGPCNVSLNLTALIQGFYRSATDDMAPVLNNQGEPNGLLDCDTVLVELRDATTPYAVAYSYTGVIGTNGVINCTFPAAALGNSYYIAVHNRTAVETWSANPMTMALTNSYDFRTSDAQAFGNNQILVNLSPVRWALFSGDIDQTGGIDGDDFNLLDPDIQTGNGGYLSTDLDGSGGVDGDDFNIFDPNSQAGVGAILP